MPSSPDLRLAWCSYQAAKYAVSRWHYSRKMPKGKLVPIGVWESGRYVGAVIFGLGSGDATNGRRFGLAATFEVAELVRIALCDHKTPVSRLVAIALRMLTAKNPGLRLIVSYADPRQGHHGGIYQAGNWLYIGLSQPDKIYVDALGREHHSRTVSPSGWKSHFGARHRAMRTSDAVQVIRHPGKHTYLMPLSGQVRRSLAGRVRPYPSASRLESEAPVVQAGQGAAMRPTRSTTRRTDGPKLQAIA